MEYKITYNKVTFLKSQRYSTYINGSNYYTCAADGTVSKKNTPERAELLKSWNTAAINEVTTDRKIKNNAPPTEREYKINKNIIVPKINSFANLSQSKKFMIFWTVSYPLGFPDVSSAKVLNNVFTRIRKVYGKFSYIYVNERQANGTIHQHLLTNKFVNLRIVNYWFAKAIQNEIYKSKLKNISFNYKIYNGLDVKFVRSLRRVKSYITKYILKSDESFKIRAYAMSQDVSRLFTSIVLPANIVEHVFELFNDLQFFKSTFYDDFYNLYFLKHPFPDAHLEHLFAANDYIYNTLENRN